MYLFFPPLSSFSKLSLTSILRGFASHNIGSVFFFFFSSLRLSPHLFLISRFRPPHLRRVLDPLPFLPQRSPPPLGRPSRWGTICISNVIPENYTFFVSIALNKTHLSMVPSASGQCKVSSTKLLLLQNIPSSKYSLFFFFFAKCVLILSAFFLQVASSSHCSTSLQSPTHTSQSQTPAQVLDFYFKLYWLIWFKTLI